MISDTYHMVRIDVHISSNMTNMLRNDFSEVRNEEKIPEMKLMELEMN